MPQLRRHDFDIVPARNEAAVIVRALREMATGAASDELDIIVACNGCTDNIAAAARAFGPPVRVVETCISSKTHGLNLGDESLAFPRIYSDADVLITIASIRALPERLRRGDVLTVAPRPRFDLRGCSWAVRTYFDIPCAASSRALDEYGREQSPGARPPVQAPVLWLRLFVYSLVTILARLRARIDLRRNTMVWEPDESSRAPLL